MSKPPVVFISFANNNRKPLPHLKKEGALIRKIFSQAADNQQIQFHLEGFADTNNITDYLIKYKDRVLIFHYGGHANSKSLFLNDQMANGAGIARQLVLQQSIQLVFLNGCSTKQQVDLLLALGIPAIIATSTSVGDKRATQFAEKFYTALLANHTIKEAFNIAAAYHQSKFNYLPEIHRDTGMRNEQTNELPWGLYTKDENTLDILLIPEKKKTGLSQINVVEDSDLEAEEDIQIGDEGENYPMEEPVIKNKVKGSRIKGRNIRIGDIKR